MESVKFFDMGAASELTKGPAGLEYEYEANQQPN